MRVLALVDPRGQHAHSRVTPLTTTIITGSRMTQKPDVLVTRLLPPAVMARLARDYAARTNNDDQVYAATTLAKRSEGCQALLVCPTDRLSAEVIATLPDSVRVIATFSVGYEHIDLDAAKARGIAVTNTPDVLTDATADVAMMLLLGAARRATEAEAILRSGQWRSWATTWMLGTQVTGKKLGILGMGRIGHAVARRARGFDMEIHYHNRRPVPDTEAVGAIYHERGEDMLTQCEFLSIHCPATPETHHWLNAARIAAMPDGAIVVNTARGPVVDDNAMIAALRSGKLAAAGLDVYQPVDEVRRV